MIHFAFELEADALDGQPTNLRGFSAQDDNDLIELPLIRCKEGQLRLAARQHDGFNPACCAASLDLLPEEIRSAVLLSLAESPTGS